MLQRPLLRAGLVLLSIAALLALVVPIAAAAPSYDEFGGAIALTLPYSATLDTSEATADPNDPVFCFSPLGATVWFALASAQSQQIDANTFGSSYNTSIIVVTGSPGAFDFVACGGPSVQFFATAGQTYYVMIGAFSAYPGPGAGGTLALAVNGSPPPSPVASFNYFPNDPSTFDTIQFFNSSYDPLGMSFQTTAWNFGDGTTSGVYYTSHRYAQNGDYTVQLTVTTPDGRTASTSQVVQVRTHDVSIVKFSAPNSARSNQTGKVSVGLASKLTAETVQVDLYKILPGGANEQWIGMQQLLVPARSSNRTVTVNFSYTFTSDDATIGKVTFRAVATIAGARDALPGDNEARATTKVTR